MSKTKRCKDKIAEEVLQDIETEKTEIRTKEDEKKTWLKLFSFPKQGVSVKAKSLEDAQRQLKMIVAYQNKSI